MNYIKWWLADAALGLLAAVAILLAMPLLLLASGIAAASDAAHIELLRAGAARKTNQERKRAQR